jgi:hypothetical protein
MWSCDHRVIDVTLSTRFPTSVFDSFDTSSWYPRSMKSHHVAYGSRRKPRRRGNYWGRRIFRKAWPWKCFNRHRRIHWKFVRTAPHIAFVYSCLVGVVGTPSPSDTESDTVVADVKASTTSKGKRKVGERLRWASDDEDESGGAYEKFKNRKTAKRKKIAESKRKLKSKAKDNAVGRKKKEGDGERRKERTWGDISDYEDMDESIPEYILKRRKEFDDNCKSVHEAG